MQATTSLPSEFGFFPTTATALFSSSKLPSAAAGSSAYVPPLSSVLSSANSVCFLRLFLSLSQFERAADLFFPRFLVIVAA